MVAARRWLRPAPKVGRSGSSPEIERAGALKAIDGILEKSDGIMVARGDLGIEVPLERLALEQKQLIGRANAAGKFAIVATRSSSAWSTALVRPVPRRRTSRTRCSMGPMR